MTELLVFGLRTQRDDENERSKIVKLQAATELRIARAILPNIVDRAAREEHRVKKVVMYALFCSLASYSTF